VVLGSDWTNFIKRLLCLTEEHCVLCGIGSLNSNIKSCVN